jgi:hypothetical protein
MYSRNKVDALSTKICNINRPIIELVNMIITTPKAHSDPFCPASNIPPTRVGIILTVRIPPQLTKYVVQVKSLKAYWGSLKINYPIILALSIRLNPVNPQVMTA